MTKVDFSYQHQNNILQTRDDNEEKGQLGGLLLDPIPNSQNKHHKVCVADSRENYKQDVWSERVNHMVMREDKKKHNTIEPHGF